MRRSKVLWLGILTALLLGATIGSALVTVPVDGEGAPILVPAGRVGDELVYTHHVRDPGQEPGPDGEEWIHLGEEAVHIVRLGTTLDERGELRRVVEIATNRSRALTLPGLGTGIVLDSLAPTTEYDHVDLETRFSVRTDLDRASFSDTTLRDDLAVQLFFDKRPNLNGLQYQDLTFKPWQDVTHLNEHDVLMQLYGVIMFGFGFTGDSVLHLHPMTMELRDTEGTFQAFVAEHGVVDGQDAIGIRSERILPMKHEQGSGLHAAFWTEERAGGKIHLIQTDWVTAQSPYPVATMWTTQFLPARGEPEVLGESLRSLAVYEPGDGPVIPWSAPQPESRFDRTPGPAPVAEGSGSRLPYPMSLALADIDASPTLLPFHLWRQSNPDAVLAGFEHRPGESHRGTAQAYQWRFYFAVLGADSYEVRTERVGNGSPITSGGLMSQAWDPHDPDGLPVDGLTLAAAERLWVETIGREGVTPNHVRWGRYTQGSSSPATSLACLDSDLHITMNIDDPLRTLIIGYENGRDCTNPENAIDRSILILDIETGAPHMGYGVYREFAYPGLPLQGDAGPKPGSIGHATVPMSLTAARIEGAAFGSTSLLLLFLLGYFLPLLKFFGAKGIGLIPGFSRLAKADLLDNELRDLLVTMIRENPGIHASELRRRAGTGWGTVVHHLGVLEKNGLISSLTSGRNRCFFPVGDVDWSRRGQTAVLANERTRHLYEIIAAEPGVPMGEVARAAGIGLSTAGWHLDRLEDCGLVGRVKRGRRVHLYTNTDPPVAPTPDPYDGMEIS